MKSLTLRIGTIAIALFWGIISANASDFFFDRKMVNNLLVSKIKYEKNYDGYFEQTFKYDYSYNLNNRIKSIEVRTWDAATQQWQANHKITYGYNLPNFVELSQWNDKTKSYDKIFEKIEYQINENDEIRYLAVTDKKGNKTEAINHFELLTEK